MLRIFGSKQKDSCHRIKGMLSPYIDGRLSVADRNMVNRHVELCPQCRRELQSMEVTVQLLRRVPAATPSRSFTLAQAPKRQSTPIGIRISSWADGVVVALTPQANWLRTATAVAVIALMVMVTGDLTGTLHTDGDSGKPAFELSAINEGGETVASSEDITTPTPSPETGSMVEATPASESTPVKVAADLTDNESTEDGSPPASVDSFPTNPFEVNELLEETPVEDSEAFSWLRPTEIILAALALLLACGTLWHRQARRSSSR